MKTRERKVKEKMENNTVELLQSLLKKETAALPRVEGGILYCPECGRTLPSHRRHQYCPRCGQKMKYSGKEEKLARWDPRYNRPRILIDMDDTINNFLGYLCEAYNERYGENLKLSDMTDWDITKFMGQRGIELFKEEGFFEKIPEKKNALKAIKKLIESADYDVYVVTACTTNHELEEKFKWFEENLPEFNKDRIIKCKEKEIIHGDVLIDDNVANLDRCSPFMRCVLFDMPHNREEDRYPRIKSLSEVIPLLKEWFY